MDIAIQRVNEWKRNGQIYHALVFFNLNLEELPELPHNLIYLDCGWNKLKNLPLCLPPNLQKIHCGYNNLISLPDLPCNLKELHCHCNKLTSLPRLPDTLEKLNCNNNLLINLPKLPNNLINLDCIGNQISYQSNLPDSLQELSCDDNLIFHLTSSKNLKSIITQNKYIDCNNIDMFIENIKLKKENEELKILHNLSLNETLVYSIKKYV